MNTKEPLQPTRKQFSSDIVYAQTALKLRRRDESILAEKLTTVHAQWLYLDACE